VRWARGWVPQWPSPLLRAGSKWPSRAGAVEGVKPREVEKCRRLTDLAPRKRGEGQGSGLGR